MFDTLQFVVVMQKTQSGTTLVAGASRRQTEEPLAKPLEQFLQEL